MTQKTRNTSTKQWKRPFYLTTPLFRQANQTGVQGKSKDRETSLEPGKAGTHKVESNQETVPRKVFTDGRGSNKQHSVLCKAAHPRNILLPKGDLLPERFVNLLMNSGRKDKARKCLTLALLSITGRIGIPDPLKSFTDLSSKQNQIDLKPLPPSAPQVLTSKNKANDKQGLTPPLSPKNQGETPLSSRSKKDKPSNVLQGLPPTVLRTNASHKRNSLINACLANLKAVQKGFAPLARTTLGTHVQSNSYREIERKGVSSENLQSLPSMYRANPASRIKAIERIERGLGKGRTALSLHEERRLVERKQQPLFAQERLGINGEGGEKLGLQQHPFLAWKDLLSVPNSSGLVRCAKHHLCVGKGERDLELAHAPSQSNSSLYLGGLPTSKQRELFLCEALVRTPLTNQLAQNLQPTLSLPFYGKRFETTSPVLLSQNSYSLSFVRETLRERFVLTGSGIERRQETREGRDYLMGLLCQSFLSGLGCCKGQCKKGCSANLTVVGLAKAGGWSLNTNKTRLLRPPRPSALFRWRGNRFLPLIGTAVAKGEVGFQTYSLGGNHYVKGWYAQLVLCEAKSVEKPINWFSHFLARNNSLEKGVEAVRGLFPFAQSTKAERSFFAQQQNLANPKRIGLLAKPRTVGKKWVGPATVQREGLVPVRRKPNPSLWGLFPDVGNNPQGGKEQGLRDLYIWHTQVLLKGVQRVQPALEVRRVRKGRNTFQVPAVVKQKRGEKLAIKWIVDSARRSRQKGNKGFSESLGNQLLQSFDRLGEARSKRNELLRLAESNRPFLRFRWW